MKKDNQIQNILNKLVKKLAQGELWQQLFSGVASINISSDGSGFATSLRFTKKEGVPYHLVPEGTPGAAVIGVKWVNELDFYNLSLTQLAKLVNLTAPKTTAMVRYLKIQDNEDYFKLITIGKTTYGRYSQKARERILLALNSITIDQIWLQYKPHHKNYKI